jgi:hypothetical protein
MLGRALIRCVVIRARTGGVPIVLELQRPDLPQRVGKTTP